MHQEYVVHSWTVQNVNWEKFLVPPLTIPHYCKNRQQTLQGSCGPNSPIWNWPEKVFHNIHRYRQSLYVRYATQHKNASASRNHRRATLLKVGAQGRSDAYIFWERQGILSTCTKEAGMRFGTFTTQTIPNNLEQNGTVEIINRTLMDDVRTAISTEKMVLVYSS